MDVWLGNWSRGGRRHMPSLRRDECIRASDTMPLEGGAAPWPSFLRSETGVAAGSGELLGDARGATRRARFRRRRGLLRCSSSGAPGLRA
uniref:Uncharacterized protein n=1 Tax=Arundo donax TaxID=35708 RepID=A0A0A9FZF2_ARUDO